MIVAGMQAPSIFSGNKRRSRVRGGFAALAVLASMVTAAIGAWLDPAGATPSRVYEGLLQGCRVTDGDTIRCGRERIRLLAIDAPELPGHCRPGRSCVQGDPFVSRASLARAMVGRLTIRRIGEDRYGRTLALVSGARGDLSCWQLAQRQAIYKPRWDDGWAVARICAAAR